MAHVRDGVDGIGAAQLGLGEERREVRGRVIQLLLIDDRASLAGKFIRELLYVLSPLWPELVEGGDPPEAKLGRRVGGHGLALGRIRSRETEEVVGAGRSKLGRGRLADANG